jgi:hypothetical protein
MNNETVFYIAETVAVTLAAIFIFKGVKDFFRCSYSFLFSGYYIFFKELWEMHFMRSTRFAIFGLLIWGVTYLNAIIFL